MLGIRTVGTLSLVSHITNLHCPFFRKKLVNKLAVSYEVFVLINTHAEGESESDYDINQLFIPFRGYCARKGVSRLISC